MRIILTVAIITIYFYHYSQSSEDDFAQSYLDIVNEKLSSTADEVELAQWTYCTNLTKDNGILVAKALFNKTTLQKNVRHALIAWGNFSKPDLKRQFAILTQIDNSILPQPKHNDLLDIISTMHNIVAQAKIQDFKITSKYLNNEEIKEIIANSKNTVELKHIWLKYSAAIGPKILKIYPNYVRLKREVAELHGVGLNELWTREYEQANFHGFLENLVEQISPVYKEIHAFMRSCLKKLYTSLSGQAMLPIHLTRTLNGEDFQWLITVTLSLENRTRLYPNLLESRKISRLKIYKMVEDILASMNFPRLPNSLWDKSLFAKPKDRDVLDSMAAFFVHKDYRILDCSSSEDLTSLPYAFIAEGSVQAYLNSEGLPFAYRHDLPQVIFYFLEYFLKLVINSGSFLNSIASLDDNCVTPEDIFNNLFYNALRDIPLIMSNFVVYNWRRSVFSGITTQDNYNFEWWRLSFLYQGIEPPQNRSNKDFDFAFDVRVFEDSPSFVKILAKILAHQVHKELCVKVGQYDFGYNSKALFECKLLGASLVGDVIVRALKAGRSKRWDYVLEVIEGEKKYLDAGALLEYYKPLTRWLTEENERNGEVAGWGGPKNICVN